MLKHSEKTCKVIVDPKNSNQLPTSTKEVTIYLHTPTKVDIMWKINLLDNDIKNNVYQMGVFHWSAVVIFLQLSSPK